MWQLGFCFLEWRGRNRPQQIAATKSLPAAAQQVIARLGELNRIPDGEWRVHPGDLPHGESLDLDDSAWPIAKPGSEYSDDAVWFRQWIEIPKNLHGYDLTGAKIWFQFQARTTGREAVTEIVYLNGAPHRAGREPGAT